MDNDKSDCVFIVWKAYQRRAEVLAPLFNAELRYFPHLFRSKFLRPLDYFYKLFATIVLLIRNKPAYAIVQAPPHFSALPPLLLGVPYIVDGHNGIFQSYWHRLPLFSTVMKKARAIIVHNTEFLSLFGNRFPEKQFIVISDPLEQIAVIGVTRKSKQILFVCSFDQDEPIDAIIDTIERCPEYEFIITADPKKLAASQRQRLESCRNLQLTGFLSTDEYHKVLCSSIAAIALTNMEATQQSGACEALSSDTELIVTGSALSKELFGDWAIFVENDSDAIVDAIHGLNARTLNLELQRKHWNDAVLEGVAKAKSVI